MARLQVTLWNADGKSTVITDDDQAGQQFVNLNQVHKEGYHAQSARIDALPGYVSGDHAFLLATPQVLDTDQIVLDPAVTQAGTKLDLHDVDKGFADRTQAVVFVLNNAGPMGACARAVCLNSGDRWDFPSLVFYPFEQVSWRSTDEPVAINFERRFFLDKLDQIRVDALVDPAGVVRLFYDIVVAGEQIVYPGPPVRPTDKKFGGLMFLPHPV
jgi:hypothetical protein